MCRLNNPSAYLVRAHPFNPSPERGELYQKRAQRGRCQRHIRKRRGESGRETCPSLTRLGNGRDAIHGVRRPLIVNPENDPELFSNVEKLARHCLLFVIWRKRLERIANDSNPNRRAVPSINFEAVM